MYSTFPVATKKTADFDSRSSWRSVIELLTAVVAAAPTFLGWSDKYPLLSVIGLCLAATVLIWLGRHLWSAPLRWISMKWRDAAFITENSSELVNLHRRFGRFTSNNDSRALMSILRSIVSLSNSAAISNLISNDYLGEWLGCYELKLTKEPSDINDFLLRGREFTGIVSSFNRHYVLRVQRDLASLNSVPPHYIDALEEFREEFNAFLRDLELWADKTNRYGMSRFPKQELFWRISLTSYFERVATFRRSTVASAS